MKVRKKILITGSNGLLGQKLVKQLLQNNDFEFLATSSGTNRISKLPSEQYATLDITSIKDIEAIFNSFSPDVVINTAAMTNVDACESEKDKCWEINVTAVQLLVDACKKNNTHLIHLSTDFVFDGEDGPYEEDAIPNPLSYYGTSKLAAEKLIQDSGLEKWAIARTIIVYGVGEQMSRSNIVLWAKSALEKGNPLTIVDDQFRSPTFADDLATGCLLIAEKEAQGIYHLSGKNIMSIIELVRSVAKFYNLDDSKVTAIKTASLNQTAKRPPYTGFILDKAVNTLGYNPHSFEEGLALLNNEL